MERICCRLRGNFWPTCLPLFQGMGLRLNFLLRAKCVPFDMSNAIHYHRLV